MTHHIRRLVKGRRLPLLLASLIIVLLSGRQALAAGAISGTVFRDYNANGGQDTAEPGLSGIIITAIDDLGNSATTTSGADGSYTLASLAGSAARVEFTVPSSMAAVQDGAAGATSVQFVDISGGDVGGVDASFNNPTHYCHSTPLLFTTCFVGLDNQTGPFSAEAVTVAVSYGADGTAVSKSHMTAASEMGSAFGVAWQASTGRIFTAAYIKTSTGLGPNGSGSTTTGGIYEVTVATAMTATASLFLDLHPIVDTGADPHPAPTDSCTSAASGVGGSNNNNCWWHDGGAFTTVGKRGLGDLDFNADQTVLYTVNLNSGELVELPVGNPAAAPAPGDIN
ncbi:MAG: hypothetical protein KDE04_12055, partial [Anaerolineales bacterium]|nr:hypothetical protein [Anaerolineales bacterium]